MNLLFLLHSRVGGWWRISIEQAQNLKKALGDRRGTIAQLFWGTTRQAVFLAFSSRILKIELCLMSTNIQRVYGKLHVLFSSTWLSICLYKS
jgi:hypothetical protein